MTRRDSTQTAKSIVSSWPRNQTNRRAILIHLMAETTNFSTLTISSLSLPNRTLLNCNGNINSGILFYILNVYIFKSLTFIDNQHIKLRQTRRNGVKLNIEYDYLDGDELEKFVLEPELKPPVFIEPEVKPPVVNSPKKKVEPEAKPVIQNSLKKVKREISDEENDTKSRKTYKRIRIEDDEDEEEDEVASKANANETKENEFQETEFKITKMEDVPEENVKPIKNEKPAPKEIPKQVSRFYQNDEILIFPISRNQSRRLLPVA